MFKHILLPSDGSRLAARGVKAGVRLARALEAHVTGVYVIGRYVPAVYPEAAMAYVPGTTPADFEELAAEHAGKVLSAIQRASAAGVRCATQRVVDASAWRGILKVARARKCDAIVMASHGRGGLGGLILGSETARVLAHSKVPVLVVR